MIFKSDKEIQDTIGPYGFLPDSGECASIRNYVSLLMRWNKRISLTTVVDPTKILRFHFGESIFAASIVPIEKGRLADVGSGAGFPGLALGIAFRRLSISLIESSLKKAAFLAEVTRELNLANVEIIRQQYAEIPANLAQFDYITARALGNYQALLDWTHRRMAATGRVILWLGEAESRSITIDRSFIWHAPVLIPGSRRRFILAGAPAKVPG
jgi:16S rRNA (guanine527-N7)-methyltransferase